VLAPGRRIVAPLASAGCTLATTYPDRIAADGQHIRLSGTSMAAPVITGVVALLYERTPNLTPDQVKWLLLKSTYSYKGMADKVGAIDAMKAMTGATAPLGAANQGLTPNSGIAPGTDTATWGQNGYWDTAYWDTAYWDTGYWDVATDYD
jgi:serine protease AprX